MTKIEFDIRCQLIAERIRQLQSELIVLMDETPNHGTKNRLHLAGIQLNHAAEELEVESPLDLETTLKLSIQYVRQQKQCAEVGGEVLSTNEKAQGTNLSLFPNRQHAMSTIHNTSGE